MTRTEPESLPETSIHTGTSRYPDSDPNEYDSLTVRTYTGRSQIDRYMQTSDWRVPAIAYALLLVSLIFIF